MPLPILAHYVRRVRWFGPARRNRLAARVLRPRQLAPPMSSIPLALAWSSSWISLYSLRFRRVLLLPLVLPPNAAGSETPQIKVSFEPFACTYINACSCYEPAALETKRYRRIRIGCCLLDKLGTWPNLPTSLRSLLVVCLGLLAINHVQLTLDLQPSKCKMSATVEEWYA